MILEGSIHAVDFTLNMKYLVIVLIDFLSIMHKIEQECIDQILIYQNIQQKVQTMFDISSLKMEEKMFYNMHHCLKKSKTIQQHAIFLIGQIRAGKSTTYNWITHPQILQGQTFDLQTKYVLTKDESTAAQIDYQYQSVTLIPNMVNIMDEQTTSTLIDFPGFHDSRTSADMMLVNYVINTCFQHSTMVKFIIVVSDVQFRNTNGHAFINTIKQFVKLFRNFGPEERIKLYKSASLLITSAHVTQYDSSKQLYLSALKQNMQKIKKLHQKNEEVKKYYKIIEELISSIVADKRLELFKVAQQDQIAGESPIIPQLNNCGWEYFSLKPQRQQVVYPYEEYFLGLNQEERQDINQIIMRKVRYFQTLQMLLAKTIDTYLQNPLNRFVSLTNHFIQLKKILQANRVHEDIPALKYELKNENIQEYEDVQISYVQLDPIIIYQNIANLVQLTFQIKLDEERQIQERKNVPYFQYLSGFFKKCINLFSSSFALKEQFKQITEIINFTFLEIFEQLIYITKINKSLKSFCIQYLKQSIQIMNRCNYRKDEIPPLYIQSLKDQQFESGSHEYTVEELGSIVSLLDSLDWKEYEIKDRYILNARIMKLQGKMLIESKQYQLSAQKSMLAFDNVVRHKFCLQYQAQHNKKTSKDENQFLEDLMQEIVKNVYISTFYLDNKKSMQIFQTNGLLLMVEQSLQDIQRYEDKNSIHKSLQFYASFYQQNQQYLHAANIYKKLSANAAIRRLPSKLEKIKQKMTICSNKSKLMQQKQKPQRVTKLEIQIRTLNTINSQIINSQIVIKQAQIRQEIREYYQSKLIKVSKNQFDYTISKNPTYNEIITVSESLIKKINKRKVILMLGDNSGKTLAFYWLLQKQIISRKVRKTQYIYDLVQNKQKMHRKGEEILQTPNIYQFSQGELLIDFSRLFQTKFINTMIQVYLLHLIIQHSKQIKFLLVIKDDNYSSNEIIKLIDYIKNTFNWSQKDLIQNKSLSLLINYSSLKQTSLQNLNKFFQQFSKHYKNQELFQQIYKIDISLQKQYSECIQNIKNNNRMIFLPRANELKLQSFNFKEYNIQRNWNYIETDNINKSSLSYSLKPFQYIPKQVENIKNIINSGYIRGQQLMRKIGSIFKNLVKQQPAGELYSKEQIDELQIHLQIKAIDPSSQLLRFKQIFAFYELLAIFYDPQSLVQSVLKARKIILGLINSMKKVIFVQINLLKCLYLIERQFIEILNLMAMLEKVNSSLGEHLSYFRCLPCGTNSSMWFYDAYQQTFQFIVKNIKQLNIQMLISEELALNINPTQDLLKFINFYEDSFKNTFKKHRAETILIQRLALIKCKQFTIRDKDYPNTFYCLVLLFQMKYSQFEQSQEHKQDRKKELIKLMKEIILVMAEVKQSYAFQLSDLLHCDELRCDIFNKLISIKQKIQQKLQVLPKYLKFLLEIGQEFLFLDLYQNYKEFKDWKERQSLQEKYRMIMDKKLKLVSRKRNFYNNIDKIQIEKLKYEVEKVKNSRQTLRQISI